ncbi:MAG: hypothetical protein WA058_02480 [Minisyncoccia bacterium]
MKIFFVLFALGLLAGCGSYPTRQSQTYTDVQTRTVCDPSRNCKTQYWEKVTTIVPPAAPAPLPMVSTFTVFSGPMYAPSYFIAPVTPSLCCFGGMRW